MWERFGEVWERFNRNLGEVRKRLYREGFSTGLVEVWGRFDQGLIEVW